MASHMQSGLPKTWFDILTKQDPGSEIMGRNIRYVHDKLSIARFVEDCAVGVHVCEHDGVQYVTKKVPHHGERIIKQHIADAQSEIGLFIPDIINWGESHEKQQTVHYLIRRYVPGEDLGNLFLGLNSNGDMESKDRLVRQSIQDLVTWQVEYDSLLQWRRTKDLEKDEVINFYYSNMNNSMMTFNPRLDVQKAMEVIDCYRTLLADCFANDFALVRNFDNPPQNALFDSDSGKLIHIDLGFKRAHRKEDLSAMLDSYELGIEPLHMDEKESEWQKYLDYYECLFQEAYCKKHPAVKRIDIDDRANLLMPFYRNIRKARLVQEVYSKRNSTELFDLEQGGPAEAKEHFLKKREDYLRKIQHYLSRAEVYFNQLFREQHGMKHIEFRDLFGSPRY